VRSDGKQYLVVAGALAGATIINLIVREWMGAHAPSMVYLLTIVLLALVVGRGPTLLAGTLGALLWNFLFLEPIYTLRISSLQDGLLFVLFFVLSMVLGQLTARLRAQQDLQRQREEEATFRYLLTRALAEGSDLSQVLAIAVRHLGERFQASVAVGLKDESEACGWVMYPFGTYDVPLQEWGVMTWALRHSRPAGRTTDTLGASNAYYAPLLTPNGCIGVVALHWKEGGGLDPNRQSLLESSLHQIAIALDRQRLRDAAEEARRSAESERLGKTLLNSVSHELRTPLAAIATASGALRDSLDPGSGSAHWVSEIEEASSRLNRLVRNLLDVARLESGHIRPNLDWCDPGELCRSAIQASGVRASAHPFVVHCETQLPLVRTDFVLMEQVLLNLLTNAMVHTPAESPIELAVQIAPGWVEWRVVDQGSGIPEAERDRVFGKFQRLPDAPPGGTGLGLSIVKGFVDALNGTVHLDPRPGGGSVFRVRLPRGESPSLPPEVL
jgi:two-component system sensor histidine kinase KdpD